MHTWTLVSLHLGLWQWACTYTGGSQIFSNNYAKKKKNQASYGHLEVTRLCGWHIKKKILLEKFAIDLPNPNYTIEPYV